MGNIKLTGEAKRQYRYDSMKITVGFKTFSKTASIAVKNSLKQSDEFIGILYEFGIDKESISLGENTVKEYYRDEPQIQSLREIKIDTPFNMPFLNTIMDIIVDKKYDGQFTTSFISEI